MTDIYKPEHALADPDTGQKDEDGYTPVFSDTVRTIVYIACGIIGTIGGICTIVAAAMSAPVSVTITAAVCAFAAPYIATMFGVAYNPVRMADKR